MALVCPHADPGLDGVTDYTRRLVDALRGHGLLAEVVPAADLAVHLAGERE